MVELVAETARARSIVLDPPRAGAREQSTRIAESAVPVVVAVSCNPAIYEPGLKYGLSETSKGSPAQASYRCVTVASECR